MAWHNDDQLNRDAALAIARELDQAKNILGTEVRGGHVWHCSLSLRAEEGDLTDEALPQTSCRTENGDYVK